jgi:hypothetical protein
MICYHQLLVCFVLDYLNTDEKRRDVPGHEEKAEQRGGSLVQCFLV